MAQFNIFTGNLKDGPLESIQEHVKWVECGLRACGHDVSVNTKEFREGVTTVFLEWSVEPEFQEFMVKHVRPNWRKYPYVVIVTEKLNAGSFNQRTPGTIQRYQWFSRYADRARQLWTLVPGDEKKLSFINPRTGFLAMGWNDEFFDPVDPDDHVYDYTLHGSGMPERDALVKAMRERGMSVLYHSRIVPMAQRNEEQRPARVVLSPRIFGWFPIPSGTRVARVMHTSSVCGVERCPIMPFPQAFSPCNAEGEAYIDFLADLLPRYRKEAERAQERYRSEMPDIKGCMEACLDGNLFPL